MAKSEYRNQAVAFNLSGVDSAERLKNLVPAVGLEPST